MELFINGIVPSYRSAVALLTGTKKMFQGYERFFIRLFGSVTFTATLKLVSRVGLP